jgi:hypothetical protein
MASIESSSRIRRRTKSLKMKTSSASLVLAKLKEQGVITESEFLQMKQDLLKTF